MKAAFLFPGQGAQSPGMGRELYENHPEVRRSFEEASEAAGQDVWAMCVDADGSLLSRTRYVQPAMVALECAIGDLLTGKFGLKPTAAAGLSLGEYAALHCAGALSLAEAIRLVELRGRLMEQCAEENPGAMAAVLGLEREKVEQACETARNAGFGVWPCNYNCPGQIVMSGLKAGVDEAGKVALALGAKRVMPLNVSGAFHTPLMQKAAQEFAPALNRSVFTSPVIPVYSNATGLPHGADIPGAMARQITSPVYWEDTLKHMREAGVEAFVEIGPGRTLSGFVKKTLEGAIIINIEDAESLEKALGQLS